MARSNVRPARSMWLTLIFWIAPALVALVVGAVLVTGSTATNLADSAYDRSIAGALRAIDLNISTESGGIGIELPYPLFEAFEATASGKVYFRVSTEDGLVQLGDSFLPEPQPVSDGGFHFYNDTFLGTPVRMGILKRVLDKPLYGAAVPQTIVIQVAESMQSRDQFRSEIVKRMAVLNLVSLIAVIVLLVAGVTRALSPLAALRAGFEKRDPDDLSPVDPSGLPQEVHPLIDTFNRLMGRHAKQAETQRQFLDDASHQLKTPIAVLRTQIDYALLAGDRDEQRSTLESMRGIVERAARTTSHFLSLARARNFAQESGSASHRPIDLKALLTELARMRLADARRLRVDLDLDLPETETRINGSETLLFEAVSNLLDNAIRHSPRGGSITLSLETEGSETCIRLVDQGPGMEPDALARAGDRFIETSGPRAGSGLGLAVVMAVAEAHGGSFAIRNGPERGLIAELRFRAAGITSKSSL